LKKGQFDLADFAKKIILRAAEAGKEEDFLL